MEHIVILSGAPTLVILSGALAKSKDLVGTKKRIIYSAVMGSLGSMGNMSSLRNLVNYRFLKLPKLPKLHILPILPSLPSTHAERVR